MLAMDCGGIDRDLRNIIGRCLKERPQERYTWALDLATDLKRYMEGRPLACSESSGIAKRAVTAILKNRRRLAGGLGLAGVVLAAGWTALRATDEWFVSQRITTLLDTAEAEMIRGDPSRAAANLMAAEKLSADMWLISSDQHRLESLVQEEQTRREAADLRRFADELRIQIGARPVDGGVSSRCAREFNQHEQLQKAVAAKSSGWARDTARDMIELALLGQSVVSSEPTGPEKELRDSKAPEFTELVSVLLTHPREPALWGAAPPRGAFDYYFRARAWCLLGDLDRASRDFEQATSLEPAWAWAAYGLGHCNLLRGRWADAVSNFTVVVSLLPDRTECRMARGQAYQKAGDLARARADFDQALAQCPQSAEAAFARGTINYALGRFPEAILDFERARDAGMEITKVTYNLALCYVATHDPGRALRSVREALSANPRHEPSRLLEKKLLADKTP
jgi:tetratricopeptide (TPR) repeat protein